MIAETDASDKAAATAASLRAGLNEVLAEERVHLGGLRHLLRLSHCS